MKLIITLAAVTFVLLACTTDEPECLEVEGQAMYIQEIERITTDRVENLTYESGDIDTFIFDLTLKNGNYNSGITKGSYAIAGEMISFKLNEEYCPPTADSIFPLANTSFLFSCATDRIELIADISNRRSSNSDAWYTIDYEVIDRRIIITK